MGYDGYEELANAIIERAVKDYRTAAKIVKKSKAGRLVDHHLLRSAIYQISQIEKFFRSTYFETLSQADGEYIIRKLRLEAGYDH